MNKVILIGGNHHNGLGLVRSFGLHNIKPYGLIINQKSSRSFVSRSRYWQKTWEFKTEIEAVDFLVHNFAKESEKPVIIPWSDSAAATIDNNIYRLQDNFIVPSLGGIQGAIVEMMNKNRQIDFLKKYDLPMAKSWIVELPFIGKITDFCYPCICKPVSSYEGYKIDIKKCLTPIELEEYLDILNRKGYNRILVQEYISYDKELEFIGSCDDEPAYIISNNVRTWPLVGGTNSYMQIINDPMINKVCMRLLKALQEEKYFGMFDIELFQKGDRVLINEINWRNSGNSFFSIGTDVHYAVIWYLNAIGVDTTKMRHHTTDVTKFAMNESTDLRHVFFKGMSFREWFNHLRKTDSFALWFIKDLSPTLWQYSYLLKELLLHRRNG